MNRSELISTVSALTGLSDASAKAAYNAFEAVITEAVMSGHVVRLRGLGSLRIVDSAAKTGTTPDGKHWHKPASHKIQFRASKSD